MDNTELVSKWRKLYKLYESTKSEQTLCEGISIENALGYTDGACKYSYFHAQRKMILAQKQLNETSYDGPPK